MKNWKKVFALLLGSVMALSVFAGCEISGKVTVTDDNNGGNTPATPDTPDNPDNPDNPDTPDNPDNPDTPDTPDNPDTPELLPVVYPEDPEFIALSKDKDNRSDNLDYKASFKAHDPVIVEAKNRRGSSVFYSFSTDNDGGVGVQVRKSFNDMKTWQYVGSAIEGFYDDENGGTTSETVAQTLYKNPSFHLYDVYRWISQDTGFNCWTLWAHDVVPAANNTGLDENGGWWMYSCWTTAFGSMRSIIFKLNAQNVAGPYTFDTVIVRDNPGQDGGLNEIDPSIYYSADGSRMFMSYGSFGGGFGVIELDPATGHRLEGEDTVAGKKMVTATGFDAEGSSVAYYEREIYSGDITGDNVEDPTLWGTEGKYFMMGSDGALAYNYVMRTWTSNTPDGPFDSDRGGSGFQVAGNWTWRHRGEDENVGNAKALNFYIPGHNDMLTTTDGRHVIAYHTRVSEATKDGRPAYNEGEHFLYVSMFDFNSKGQLVINPNRYAGERVGIVTAEDVVTLTQGKYAVVRMTSSDVSYNTKREVSYAEDCVFHSDGTISGAVTGTWKLYGSHYVYIKIGNDEYYGTAMPAWIRQYDATSSTGLKENGGLTISAVTDVQNSENKIIYFNMQF